MARYTSDMRCARALRVGATLAVLLQSDVRAIVLAPDPADILRAMRLAQESAATRAQFHAPYIFKVDDATVEQIEVITEFRRYVLTAEEQLRLGNWLFARGTREAQDAVRPWRGHLSIVTRLRFHPQNTFVSIPPYEIAVGGPDVAALNVTRTPTNGFFSNAPGDKFAPLTGATIEAVFDPASIGQTARRVSVRLGDQDVARVTIDFARLE
jgi:hypothetical protein